MIFSIVKMMKILIKTICYHNSAIPFYKMKKLDIFKDGVSLPGLFLKYLMRGTDSEFSLFSEDDKI